MCFFVKKDEDHLVILGLELITVAICGPFSRLALLHCDQLLLRSLLSNLRVYVDVDAVFKHDFQSVMETCFMTHKEAIF